MPSITDRINKRLRAIKEAGEMLSSDSSWKDPNSPDYDRQKAEDALFHTLGPLTDNPKWVDGPWTSPGEPVAGFAPSGPAPQWTMDEIVIAFAGDPNLLFKGTTDHPHSPHYGNKGGAPLYRAARRIARTYARGTDRSFIMDLYGLGFIPLVQRMQSGEDQSRKNIISWLKRHVESAMINGVGGEERTNRAAGGDSAETGLRGVQSLVNETDPEAVRMAANEVKGKYQTTRSHDKNPDNPFGPFSSQYHQVAMMYADALESGDEERIEGARNQLAQIKDAVEDYSINIRGAATGLGSAISTKDRVKKNAEGEIETPINIQSMDVSSPTGDDARTMAGHIVGDDTRSDDPVADPELVNYILDIAINYDLGKLLKGTRYEALGLGGRLNPNEFRYVIRGLGPLGTNYPGRDNLRQNVDIPRESRGWWQAGEDPEIEPIPSGGKWTSIWLRNGGPYEAPSQIAAEMTEEVREFNKLGIATARTIKKKKKRGKEYEEAVSNAAVIPAQKKALAKLQAIREIHADQMGLDERTKFESAKREARIICESFDQIDCMLVVEATTVLIRRLTWGLVLEAAPKYKSTIIA
ncbi:MAG: hypothetical protein ACXADB_10600 [Candidatus Hermodarchaeia archaeon]|jgi:hypothetical protein